MNNENKNIYKKKIRIEIRRIKKSDFNIGFINVINIFNKNNKNNKNNKIDFEKFSKYFDFVINNKNIIILVAVHNNKIIGSGKIIMDYKFQNNFCCAGHIEDICVLKEYRGCSIGKKIVSTLINISRDNNNYKTILDCSDENVKFYEKLGFEKKGNEMSIYHFGLSSL